MGTNLKDTLKQATDGLMYPSESDAPLDVFVWPAAGKTAVEAVRLNVKIAAPIEERSAAELFDELAGVDEGFVRLRQVMEATLTGLTVVRFGEVEVGVYVIGRARSGE